MKFSFRKFAICLSAAFLMASNVESEAFALLGPFQSWMQATNGLQQPGDIGGPMDITNGYRWNVPVVTYGFDRSFLDFFGTNGVAAVEGAIQILNNLPPASQMGPTNYPINSGALNVSAEVENLYDLKSQTLSLLLEQMGLAQPTRYIFVLKQWNPIFLTDPDESEWPAGTIPNYIVQRNFDPQTLLPIDYVNQELYSGIVFSGSPTTPQVEFNGSQGYGNMALAISVDPFYPNLSVADSLLRRR
jgi:hypothetical protein